MKKLIAKMVISSLLMSAACTATFVGFSVVEAGPAHASYIGNPLRGCGTHTATMSINIKNSLGNRLATVKMGREFDWCRHLDCMYVYLTPCYYGTAKIGYTTWSQPRISTTTLGIGWSLHIDKQWSAWRNHVEGGNWGYHSELDTYAEFHLTQCINIWLVNQCSTKDSYSWKLAVDGSGQGHGDFNWGG